MLGVAAVLSIVSSAIVLLVVSRVRAHGGVVRVLSISSGCLVTAVLTPTERVLFIIIVVASLSFEFCCVMYPECEVKIAVTAVAMTAVARSQ